MLRPRSEFLLPALLAGLAAAAPATAGDDALAPSAEETRPLGVGATVPDVSVRTATGEPFALRAAVEKQRSVIVFYRGGW